MAQLPSTPANSANDDHPVTLFSDDRRRSGSALVLSGVLHALVMLLLSWIVLHSAAETDPVITLVLNDDLNNQMAEEFQMTPDISMLEVPQPEQSVLLPDAIPLPEDSSLDVPTGLPDISSATFGSAQSMGGGRGAAANIQGRVNSAGGRQGEVQFALAWENFHDVDLHVITPSGEHIAYYNRRSECAGELDVDMNVDGDTASPVENVRWLGRAASRQQTSKRVDGEARNRNSSSMKSAPVGRYTVLVHLFRLHKRRSASRFHTNYRLLVKLGERSEIVTGTVTPGKSVAVHRFIYVPATSTKERQQRRREQFEELQISEEGRAQSRLESALQQEPRAKLDSRLRQIIDRYPHTDAAIEALKITSGTSTKR